MLSNVKLKQKSLRIFFLFIFNTGYYILFIFKGKIYIYKVYIKDFFIIFKKKISYLYYYHNILDLNVLLFFLLVKYPIKCCNLINIYNIYFF